MDKSNVLLAMAMIGCVFPTAVLSRPLEPSTREFSTSRILPRGTKKIPSVCNNKLRMPNLNFPSTTDLLRLHPDTVTYGYMANEVILRPLNVQEREDLRDADQNAIASEHVEEVEELTGPAGFMNDLPKLFPGNNIAGTGKDICSYLAMFWTDEIAQLIVNSFPNNQQHTKELVLLTKPVNTQKMVIMNPENANALATSRGENAAKTTDKFPDTIIPLVASFDYILKFVRDILLVQNDRIGTNLQAADMKIASMPMPGRAKTSERREVLNLRKEWLQWHAKKLTAAGDKGLQSIQAWATAFKVTPTITGSTITNAVEKGGLPQGVSPDMQQLNTGQKRPNIASAASNEAMQPLQKNAKITPGSVAQNRMELLGAYLMEKEKGYDWITRTKNKWALMVKQAQMGQVGRLANTGVGAVMAVSHAQTLATKEAQAGGSGRPSSAGSAGAAGRRGSTGSGGPQQ
ncbi:hypothetical protein MCOR25_011144 [Pyricularia grisea]|nr:hypothetical protein MCOR25_011144 [Pyricularia grisea]